MSKNFYLISLVFLFSQFPLIAQSSLQKAYAFHDSIVSSKNLGINNGVVFRDYFKTRSKEKNHRFFNKNSFELGTISYNNQLYFDILLRYDLYKDNVIVKVLYEDGFSILKLEKENITIFSLGDSNFVDASYFKKRGILLENSFYEKLFLSSTFSLFKTSKKTRDQEIVENKFYDKFYLVEEFYLLYKDKFYQIKTKKDFKKITPNLKTQVYSFYKKNKKLFKKDKTSFYKLLIKSISKQ